MRYGDLDVHQGQRTDLAAAAELVISGRSDRELAESCPTTFIKYHKGLRVLRQVFMEPRTGDPADKQDFLLYTGKTGTGKTRRAFAHSPGSVYFKDPSNKWWDGYWGQETIVIDDYTNSSQNGLNTDYMLRLLDLYPMTLEVKGATTFMSRTTLRIIVTSNLTVETLWPTHIDEMRRRFDNIVTFNYFLSDSATARPRPGRGLNLNIPGYATNIPAWA